MAVKNAMTWIFTLLRWKSMAHMRYLYWAQVVTRASLMLDPAMLGQVHAIIIISVIVAILQMQPMLVLYLGKTVDNYKEPSTEL